MATIKERLAGPDVTRAQFDEMFVQTGLRITELRAEAAKHRHQRNELRDELTAVRAELVALKKAATK
ncbi:MAG: hypothetical protein JWR34_3915 [Mycobacterium sp.]|nr:hypothetical protein [Mycobacterium sp.]